MRFELPESVRAYYANASVEAAVNALLTKSGKMPSGLTWEELPGYHSAWVAAHRVMADYAVALTQLWDAIWKDVLPAPWKALSIDDQIADDKHSDPHPTQIWDWECITRCHEQGSETLHTCVALSNGQVSIGIGLFGRGGREARTVPLPGFERDPEYGLLWTIRQARIAGDGTIELTALLSDRDTAILALTGSDEDR